MATRKKTTTERGLGWEHQKTRDRLLAAHVDGTLCPCQPGCGPSCPCAGTTGLPMYRDPSRNYDGRPLEADHTIARAHGGVRADRLLLSTCNRSRGAGERVELITSREW